MSSAVDIQIASHSNLEKIESFFKDASYRETIEYSSSFNTRLCVERRLRLPFLDPQTGVAQKHSQLFMDKRNRMPGFRQGQIYTYPASRWRKSRRQYLSKIYKYPERPFQSLRKENETLVTGNNNAPAVVRTESPSVVPVPVITTNEPDFNGSLMEESSSLGAAGGDTSDSKDSQQQPPQSMREDISKEWFYDEIDLNDSMEDPKSPADDEYDYDPRYGSKKRRKRRSGKRATPVDGMNSNSHRKRSSGGRGRVTPACTDGNLSNLDSLDGFSNDMPLTPTSTGGRRARGISRGRRRVKNTNGSVCDPGAISEPPSFESAAAAVGAIDVVTEEHAGLRNSQKYL